MIEAARRARRPDRRSRDARLAQAMRARPARNFRRSELVRRGRLGSGTEAPAFRRESDAGLPCEAITSGCAACALDGARELDSG